jgi:16S rRNA (cytosine967-C5)-methyltransferase
MVTSTRAIAFDILMQVERGGFASDLLAARTALLEPRDAGLAAQIVFGTLRYRAQLDFLIAHYAGRTAKLDREVRIALRMGLFQVRYLERVPPHAAVGESVELVKRARKRSATGFVNAVLRKAGREAVAWPNREVELSCPEWLLARWESHYGPAAAEAIARAALVEPEVYVRAPEGGEGLEPTGVPGCFRVPPGSAVAGFRRQDIGSQSIVPLLRLEPGNWFLDLCAAPGGKTAQAIETGVHAVACDVHLNRIAQLRPLGAGLLVLDGTRPLPFNRRFDRILVDAPCSGTGTLARNPEIKWKLRPEDLVDLPLRQARLLAHARAALAPDGLLVYSTCSLEPEENEGVVGSIAVETASRLPGRDAGDGFFAAVVDARHLSSQSPVLESSLARK